MLFKRFTCHVQSRVSFMVIPRENLCHRRNKTVIERRNVSIDLTVSQTKTKTFISSSPNARYAAFAIAYAQRFPTDFRSNLSKQGLWRAVKTKASHDTIICYQSTYFSDYVRAVYSKLMQRNFCLSIQYFTTI